MKGKCLFTSHRHLTKMDVRSHCWYVKALPKGRGGSLAYKDKWLDDCANTEASRKELLTMNDRSANEWSQVFCACLV